MVSGQWMLQTLNRNSSLFIYIQMKDEGKVTFGDKGNKKNNELGKFVKNSLTSLK